MNGKTLPPLISKLGREVRGAMKAIIFKSKHILVGNLKVADSIFLRLIGLLGKSSLNEDSGLWLKPCKGVHTFGMKFCIDVVILDRANTVIDLISELKPNRFTALYPGAATILEIPAKRAAESALAKGDVIEMIA